LPGHVGFFVRQKSSISISISCAYTSPMGATKTAELALARVLLVDDNTAARLTLQTVLEAGGYRVDSAASAAEAVG
jgi:PleD family two-component response regulator